MINDVEKIYFDKESKLIVIEFLTPPIGEIGYYMDFKGKIYNGKTFKELEEILGESGVKIKYDQMVEALPLLKGEIEIGSP